MKHYTRFITEDGQEYSGVVAYECATGKYDPTEIEELLSEQMDGLKVELLEWQKLH